MLTTVVVLALFAPPPLPASDGLTKPFAAEPRDRDEPHRQRTYRATLGYGVVFAGSFGSALGLYLGARTVNVSPDAPPQNGFRNPTRPQLFAASNFAGGVAATSAVASVAYGIENLRCEVGRRCSPPDGRVWLRRSSIAWASVAAGSIAVASGLTYASLSGGNLTGGLPYNATTSAAQQDQLTAGMFFWGAATAATVSTIGFAIRYAVDRRRERTDRSAGRDVAWSPSSPTVLRF